MDFSKHVGSGRNLHHGNALDVNIVDLPSDPHHSQPFCRKCDRKLTTFLPVGRQRDRMVPKNGRVADVHAELRLLAPALRQPPQRRAHQPADTLRARMSVEQRVCGSAQREMRTPPMVGSASGRNWSCGGRGSGENAGGGDTSTARSGRRRRFREISHLTQATFLESRRFHARRSIEDAAHPRRRPAKLCALPYN